MLPDIVCILLLVVAFAAVNMRQYKWSLHIGVAAIALFFGVVAAVPAVRSDIATSFAAVMRTLAALGGAPE